MKLLLATILVLLPTLALCTCPPGNLGAGVCARLYDEEDCEGWELSLKPGYTELSFLRKNDAESVAVAPGCVFIGLDHAVSRREAVTGGVGGGGRRVIVDAGNAKQVMLQNLDGEDQLEEEISAVQCLCGSDKSSRQRPRTGNSGRNCDGNTFGGGVFACILYDDEDCQVEDWDLPLYLAAGEARSFSLLQSLRNFQFKNTIESVSVRAGCSLEAFDDSDFTDDGQTFTAPPDKDLHITLDRSFVTSDLDDDIESVRCYCK